MRTDTQLIALIREGHDGAFEILFNRYQPRLLAFCRRMVGSPQDAEDVLQEVFAAAHAAILADDRAINVRPWLYRIARNRCLSHLRKPPTADGVDSMDVHPHENGTSTLERVQRREELRAIVSDVHELPKTQRTALVLREIDDLSYADIAQAMNTTLPSVKSLMVRARMSLSQSVAARGALVPFGLLALLRKLIPAKLGGSSGAGGTAGTAGSVGTAGSAAGAAGATGGVAAGGSSLALGGVLSATSTAITGVGGALGAKAAVGVATAALLTAGVVGVEKMNSDGQKATPSADRVGASAGPGTTDGIGSSSAPGSAAKAANAAGTAAGAGRGRGPGSKAARAAVDHAHPLKAAVGHAVGRSRAAEVAAAARNTVHAAARSQLPAVSHAAGALVKPPKSVAPGLGRIIEPPRPRPVSPPSGHPLPLKPPKLPLKPPKPLATPGSLLP